MIPAGPDPTTTTSHCLSHHLMLVVELVVVSGASAVEETEEGVPDTVIWAYANIEMDERERRRKEMSNDNMAAKRTIRILTTVAVKRNAMKDKCKQVAI